MFLGGWLLAILICVDSTSIDWCEYWARMGKKGDRPECAGYELPNNIKRAETISCPKNEMYNCLDCEPTCHMVPKCRKEQCNRGCVCKSGMARHSNGKCVTLRECASHYPSKTTIAPDEEEGTVMKTVKKMVPVIVNDMWKAFFNSIRAPDDVQNTKHVELKPVNITELPLSTVTNPVFIPAFNL